MGRLYVAGFGCGSREGMTIEAENAIRSSDVIVGYTTYVELIREFFPGKRYIATGMRSESERVDIALDEALNGKTVTIICSGDPGVYGMAGLVYERNAKGAESIDIIIIPGVTAALSCGALLGAPLANDFVVISLSDLLTPFERIEKRLRAAAMGDFCIVLYNPASRHRPDHLKRACGVLLEYLSPDTICGYARNTGRKGQETGIMTLSEMAGFKADMFTTVFIGNSETRVIDGRMVTPRGYRHVRMGKGVLRG